MTDLPPPPIDESSWSNLTSDEARAIAARLSYATRFRLQADLTPVQKAFLDAHGFLVFDRVASAAEVARIAGEVQRIEGELHAAGTREIYGIPVWFGAREDGSPFLQRLAFTSILSEFVRDFVRDPRFEPVRRLVGDDARVGDREKDGVVFNQYLRAPGSLRPGLGWHTDGLRDVFYNRRLPDPQLNVGLHLDRVRPVDGGLRILPGSHTQGWVGTLFRKPYFVWHRPDPREVAVETWPGDLTVHDGRTWHRVQASPFTGARSLRRSMYVPYLTDAYQPKDERSKTPPYLRLFDKVIALKKRMPRKAA